MVLRARPRAFTYRKRTKHTRPSAIGVGRHRPLGHLTRAPNPRRIESPTKEREDMLNVQHAISIIRDLNGLPPVPSTKNPPKADNPEYLRGQLELLLNLMGYEDDGFAEMNYLIDRVYVEDPYISKA